VISAQYNLTSNSVFDFVLQLQFVSTVVMTFAIWLVSSFLFHLSSILLGGEAHIKDFIKLTGLIYVFHAIFFLIAFCLLNNIEMTQSNVLDFIKTDKTMRINVWLISIDGYIDYLATIVIVKYLYKINWLKAIGALVIPLGSIYLLGQFFAEYVL